MKAAIERGEPPKFIADWPDVYGDLQSVWRAWHHLSSSRQVTMGGAGGIPFDSIDRYATRYGVEDFEAFHRLILAMDAEYMDYLSERRKD